MNQPIPNLHSETTRQLQKYFGECHLHADSLPDLEQQLATVVRQLLRSDLNRLLHILYRIDVEEHQVKRALATATREEEAAGAIAQIIIKRELQKMQTRFRYRQN